MATQIENSVQLLVEGNDHRNFFEAMVEHLALSDIQVRNFGGVNELRRYLAGFVLDPGFKDVRRVGIVRDAEESADAAFKSVQSSLHGAGLAVPAQPAVEAPGSPSVNVLLVPDNEDAGMLETLLCRTFAGTPLARCIDDLFACVRRAAEDPPKRPEKARARAWLATRPEPHLSVGVAAKRGYWNLDHPSLIGVRSFLRALA